MSSPLLEVVVGLAFLYVLLSLGVSALTELFASWLSRREKLLRDGVEALLEEAIPDPDLRRAVLDHGLLKAPGRKKKEVEDEGARTASTAARPVYIEPALFASAVIDVLRDGGVDIDPAKMASTEGSRSAAGQVLSALWREAEQDVALFREELARWFEQMVAQIRDAYARSSRNWIFGLGLAVAVAGNIDTVHIARTLWKDSGIRAATVAAAERFVADRPDAAENNPGLEELKRELEALAFPWGWTDAQAPWSETFEGGGSAWWLNKLVGLLITALAISLGAPFWFDLLRKLLSLRRGSSEPERSRATDPPEAVG